MVLALIISWVGYGLGSHRIPPKATAEGDAQRVVSLYVDGQKRIIPTTATTVGELLSRAGVALGKGDIVEPSVSTPIAPGSFYVNVYRSHPVVVKDGSQIIHGYSAYHNPRLVLQQLGLTIYPEDILATGPITDFVGLDNVGDEITITRAKSITLSDFLGNDTVLRTQDKTVGDLLATRQIALKPGDIVNPGLNTPISVGLHVSLSRENEQVIKETESIPHATQYIRDPNLEVPTTAVEQAGADGSKVTTYRVTYKNGRVISKEVLGTEITLQPKPKIVAKGGLVTANTWYKLRLCESSNNYADKYNPSYRGAYQFGYGTWASVGGSGDPADAPPSEQDMRAQALYAARGWSPWVCASGW